LDEAYAEGLGVAAGMSDWPFYQMGAESCKQATNFSCFTQVKPLYLLNLRKGFVRPDKSYHPALRYMNILNEPDLKMPHDSDIGGPDGPIKMARAVISAFDAMLDAELEVGVTGPLINFTATFSYAICAACGRFEGRPALGNMAVLDDAMKNPLKYGYEPKHNISEAYRTRFTHSFNTQNPASDMEHQFLSTYFEAFPATPVYIGEYHRVHTNQTQDLDMILKIAEENPHFLGISIFQYQVAYWKTGSEMNFGMFGLGNTTLAEMSYFGQNYSVHCAVPMHSPLSNMSMPAAVAQVYGGLPFNDTWLCQSNPEGVALSQQGLQEIAAQSSSAQMARFVERLALHMGASVKADSFESLLVFSEDLLRGSSTFDELASSLGARPDWLEFDDEARCVADRNVEPGVVIEAIGWACSQMSSSQCDHIIPECLNNTYRVADYVFSRYYRTLGDSADPLTHCSFGGAALFAPSLLYRKWTGSARCAGGGRLQPGVAHDLRPSTSKGPSKPFLGRSYRRPAVSRFTVALVVLGCLLGRFS